MLKSIDNLLLILQSEVRHEFLQPPDDPRCELKAVLLLEDLAGELSGGER
jgi:hypothetical protein